MVNLVNRELREITSFPDWFRLATDYEPFPFQRDFAGAPGGRRDWQGGNGPPALVDVPTGLGKTAMAVLGWLWRRRFADEPVRSHTPRRLVYCLPMRVLVEQTKDNMVRWLNKLDLLDGCDAGRGDPIAVYILMGGEDEPAWDIHPERDAIIIGTQDMLLSRALNRGYAASRARWPMHFGLLNTDCLWIFDEVQLMGSGLATTAQLEAFRRQLAGKKMADETVRLNDNGCASVWMSATQRPEWLRTVDFKSRIDDEGRIDGKATLSLSKDDHGDNHVAARWTAKKTLAKAANKMGDAAPLASEIRDTHKLGTRTIVVVNTVKRACALFDALKKAAREGNGPRLVLLHSRFRPPDRAKRVAEALSDVDPDGAGTIIVSTQVIEAGVDVSATTLFTELAPWASLVQRFGRCNRRGELNDAAAVRWIELPEKDADAEKTRYPYELADLRTAAGELGSLQDVGLGTLHTHGQSLSEEQQAALFPYKHTHVIRRKDLLDLFDTTPDLAGNDIDIDRYVREIDETDVRVFWRNYGDPEKGATPNGIKGDEQEGSESHAEPAPLRDELCPAPIGEFKTFAEKQTKRVWRWNFTDKEWELVQSDSVTPGQVFLVHVSAGGYSSERGWSGDKKDSQDLKIVRPDAEHDRNEGYDDDHGSRMGVWQTIAVHTQAVYEELERVLALLPMPEADALRLAARWHDWGKAHAVFQGALPDGRPEGEQAWAKAAGAWKRYGRRHFRHELASAIGVLQQPHHGLQSLSDDYLNLVAYLIAAHHGKVRLSIRSMPNEGRPEPRNNGRGRDRRVARGVWDEDKLPSVDLGGGITAPPVALLLEPMELGLCETEPFVGQPSWVERALGLRDRLGPFRLAYLEAILRAADQRASAAIIQPAEVNGA